jgi:hypothetical protein
VSADLFDRIRAACAGVAERAEWVAIDAERLEAFARELASSPRMQASADPAQRPLGDPADTLAFVVTMDAINFGSGWFPLLRKKPGLSGYFTIATALEERFGRLGPWDAGALCALDARECAVVFGQEGNYAVDALMQHFAVALNDLGELLQAHYGGRFEALVAAADGSAAQLVRILTRMPLYRDVVSHAGLPVPLYKRAQLTASDLARAFGARGPGRFRDLDRLTLFADNLVPHVLRCEGVLRYRPELARRIDAEALLEAGSQEEVEIRAVALHAVERLVAGARAAGLDVTAAELDHRLWSRGHEPEMKAHPRHRARSVYY